MATATSSPGSSPGFTERHDLAAHLSGLLEATGQTGAQFAEGVS